MKSKYYTANDRFYRNTPKSSKVDRARLAKTKTISSIETLAPNYSEEIIMTLVASDKSRLNIRIPMDTMEDLIQQFTTELANAKLNAKREAEYQLEKNSNKENK